ncbi:type IV pilus modification protein PilV [Zhongshania guokunii]|uniref:Type IV pilus modification protein PilV n=1 Tax=Zhongshania guokunii TaxID=641783 RepID=A0ABV3U9E4_9GAMM
MLMRRGVSNAQGFTLIEVLVALVVLLVGMMGAAGLMVRTVQQEVEAYQRLQALNLLQDITDRINANRNVVSCYSNGATGITVGYGVEDIAACSSGTSEENARADVDLSDWNDNLNGAAEQNSDSENVGAMIGARGCIVQLSAVDQVYRVTVAWQGLSETVAPTEDNGCGKDSYGNEKLRRTVSAVVRIGDLS